MKYEIIPGVLENNWDEIEKKIRAVKPFAKSIHIDIIDGKFLNNKTFLDPEPFKKYTKDLIFELHMMVENPIEYLEPWADAGFKRFYGHIEKMPSQSNFATLGKKFGEVGLALDGPTPIEDINISLKKLDSILVYTATRVGFSGAVFQKKRLSKVENLYENASLPIEVDGGINFDSLPQAKNKGASRFVSTSFIFEGDPQKNYQVLQKALEEDSAK